jgi:hypothetical protein
MAMFDFIRHLRTTVAILFENIPASVLSKLSNIKAELDSEINRTFYSSILIFCFFFVSFLKLFGYML